MNFEFMGLSRKKKEENKSESFVEYKQNNVEKPIRACLIDSEAVMNPDYEDTWEVLEDIRDNGQFVNYDGGATFIKENHLRNAGADTYVISECDEKDKYSFRYQDCTGIILTGEDKDTGKQISVMTHQNPNRFLKSKREEFERDLSEIVREIKSRAKPGSLDAVIFGGQMPMPLDREVYNNSIKEIEKTIAKDLGFEPVVMTGPNVRSEEYPTEAYYDTQNRRLYLIRPSHQKMNEYNRSFLPKDLK